MDEKRITDFCQELTTIANKYKLSLGISKSGITFHDEPNQIIYAGAFPKSAASGINVLLIKCDVIGEKIK